MVRKSPNRTDVTTGSESKRPPRRAIAALVAIVVIAMLWGGLTGYVWLVLIGAVLIIATLVYFVAAAATAPGTR